MERRAPHRRTVASRRATSGLAALLLLVASACAPTLNGYVDDLDSDEDLGAMLLAKAVVTPPRSDAEPLQAALVVCRFEDAREWGDRHRIGTAVGETIAAVMSLGIAVILDGVDQVHRKQPMDGLEDGLAERVAGYLAQSGAFRSCEYDDHSIDGFFKLRERGRMPRAPDLLLTGAIHAFTGDWKPDPQAERPNGPPWDFVRGRIVATLTVLDARTRAVVWSGPVAATEDDDRHFDYRKEYGSGAYQNHLAVGTIGAFLREVDRTLRAELPAALAAR